MQLVETDHYHPQQHALFPAQGIALLTLHPSSRLMAFQTRNFEIVLRNTATGRNTILMRSPHPIKSLTFSHKYLLATQQTCHDLLVFSLKNQKLKSRLGGHRAEVTKVAYCRQNQQIVSISHQLCLVHNENSLQHLKTLKCSTSSFVDCGFSLNGGLLTTSFKDGTVLLWDPVEWEHRLSAVSAVSPKVVMGNGFVVGLYDGKRIWMGDAGEEKVEYCQVKEFWEGSVHQVLFIEHYLVVNTDSGLFIAQLKLDANKITTLSISKVDTQAACLAHTEYQSTLVVLSNSMKLIQFLKLSPVGCGKIEKVQGNPLTNQGLTCAGGYSITNNGCELDNGQLTTNIYQKAQLKVEPILQGCYNQVPTELLSTLKLKSYLKKHYSLPDKYRPLVYRSVLKLPVSPEHFRILQRKPQHPSVQLLEQQYPLENHILAQKMKQVMSLLSHWAPVLGVSQNIPSIVFPFVCLFGQDTYLCFEVLYRLFTGPLAFTFHSFPIANADVLQNLWEILKHEDPQLFAHFQLKGISFARLAWTLIESLFTTTLNRQGFLSIIDRILVKTDEPQQILFLTLGYLIFNRKRILSAKDEKTAKLLCEEEQTIHLGKYLSLVDKLQDKYSSKIRYPLQPFDLAQSQYKPLRCPEEAVREHEQKVIFSCQDLHRQKEEQQHRQQMMEDIKEMAISARRQAERKSMEQQAYRFQCEKQEANGIRLRQKEGKDRVSQLAQMMDQITQVLDVK